jgi:hypothetical protein
MITHFAVATVSNMNVGTAIASSPPLASGNANDFITPAIPAGAPLPPNAVFEAGREYSTRKHIRLHEPDAHGVTHNELAQSKRRKADVEAASVGGTLQAQIAANHATAQANHDAVMTQLALVMTQFNRQNALIARNANNPTVGPFVSLFPMPNFLLIFVASWFTHSGSSIIRDQIDGVFFRLSMFTLPLLVALLLLSPQLSAPYPRFSQEALLTLTT